MHCFTTVPTVVQRRKFKRLLLTMMKNRMKRAKRGPSWWVKSAVHNCIAHPLLVSAAALDFVGLIHVADVIYKFHDATIPPGDPRNRVRFF